VNHSYSRPSPTWCQSALNM